MAFEGDEAVKSAQRVFTVLEWFERTKAPGSTMDLARACNIPVSSTIALLKSMAACGYLAFDPISRTYFPTINIARTGSWLDRKLLPGGTIRSLFTNLRDSTGQTVTISCPNGLDIMFLAVDGRDGFEDHMRPGEQTSMFQSAAGMSALSRYPDRELRKLVTRHNQRTYNPEKKIQVDQTLAKIRKVRAVGYCAGYNLMKKNVSAITWALPAHNGRHGIVVGVGGDTTSVKSKEQHIICTTQAVLRSFGALPAFT